MARVWAALGALAVVAAFAVGGAVGAQDGERDDLATAVATLQARVRAQGLDLGDARARLAGLERVSIVYSAPESYDAFPGMTQVMLDCDVVPNPDAETYDEGRPYRLLCEES